MSSSSYVRGASDVVAFGGEKFVTTRDISQLRESFQQMELIAQRSIARKNQQILELEAELARVQKEKDGLQRQANELEHVVTVVSERIQRSLPPNNNNNNNNLIQSLDLYQQYTMQENKKLQDAVRQQQQVNSALSAELQDCKRNLDALRSILGGGDNSNNNVSNNDLVTLVRNRLYQSEQVAKDNEVKLKADYDNRRQTTLQTLRKFMADMDQIDERIQEVMSKRSSVTSTNRNLNSFRQGGSTHGSVASFQQLQQQPQQKQPQPQLAQTQPTPQQQSSFKETIKETTQISRSYFPPPAAASTVPSSSLSTSQYQRKSTHSTNNFSYN